ncbi:MAG: LapA family protein [Elusimicrobiota bacterium]
MNQLKLLIIIVFAFLVAIFAVSNTQPVPIMVFGKEVLSTVPMVVLILGAVLLGVLITAILGFMTQAKLKKKLRKYRNSCKKLRNKEEKLQLKIRKLEEKLEEEGIQPDEDTRKKKKKKDS